MYRIVSLGLVVTMIFSCRTSEPFAGLPGVDFRNYEAVKDANGSNGIVVSAHPLASKVGLYILKKGGNAVDAAIATQLALAVVYPSAGNIGGGGFMVARLSDNKILSLDYREKAPQVSHRNMYLDSNGNPQLLKSTRGASSSGVPGTVAGLFESMRYAKLPFNELIAPAVALAEKGFALSARDAAAFNGLQQDFNENNSKSNAFQRETPWRAGDLFVQKELAATLRRIGKKGAKGFYDGRTATLIVDEMKRSGGFISREDLKNYRAVWRTPHQFMYRAYSIVSMPPPSSGGVLLNQMLKMAESRIGQMKPLSVQSVQLMTEVERRAFADRAQHLGDPDFYKVPSNALVDSNYLANRMSDYDSTRAGSSAKTQPGQIPLHESEETTHISIIDKDGNAVAVTTTLNDSYGSRTVVGNAGFLLNDEMDDFSIKPGVPNMYGATGGEANAIAPGKRMLSSMTPTLVLQNHRPLLVVGTPGGTTIPTSVFQTIVDILDFGLSSREALDLPKFHHQWLPDQIEVEKNFPDSLSRALEGLGYRINQRESIGRTEIIRVLGDGSFEGAADKRGDDSAEAY